MNHKSYLTVLISLLLKNKPDLASYGFKRISVLYHGMMWPKKQPDDRPDYTRLRALAQQMRHRGHLVHDPINKN